MRLSSIFGVFLRAGEKGRRRRESGGGAVAVGPKFFARAGHEDFLGSPASARMQRVDIPSTDSSLTQVGGRCVCHSVERSYVAPIRMRVASPSKGPTSCRLGGGSPLPAPHGIERVGLRLMLKGAVKASSGSGSVKDPASGGIASLGR